MADGITFFTTAYTRASTVFTTEAPTSSKANISTTKNGALKQEHAI